ncbi:hypothetical protein PPSIR1_12848 [Plesiocystis pacifica SIR-1]|uniref:Tetratricopeptide repeat protein n=1 Tax=Plesiocystis pacifica SIR-1 TaxID=391625 RepID=A6G074_9BACT|nr:tetratricopeptide repeat protein [Plesiocystis pacifica]EDM80771.1 hypothetical protein PPSIR1_12848 [Plesiocystis pacifica SIR-1]
MRDATSPSTSLQLIALVSLASACTPRGPAPTLGSSPAQGLPEAAEAPPIDPVPEAPTEPEPKQPELELELDLELDPAHAVPGFVVYTVEQSALIPFDGSPPLVAEGLWIQDDRSSPPALRHTTVLSHDRARTLDLPPCPCLTADDACTYGSLTTRELAPEAKDARPCGCLYPEDRSGYPPPDPEWVDGEVYEPCEGEGEDAPVAIVGGRLQFLGWDWNGACYGALSIYDAFDSSADLIHEPPSLSAFVDGQLGGIECFDLEPAAITLPWPYLDMEEMPNLCEPDYYGEADIFVLRRGSLHRVEDNIHHAGGTRGVRRMRVRPDRCPSVNDPCGEPDPFKPHAQLARQSREYWIATDGSTGLFARGTRYELWRPGTKEPAHRFKLSGFDATFDVLGVRVHADLRPLQDAVAANPKLGREPSQVSPPTVALDQCPGGSFDRAQGLSARDWGNLCVQHMRADRHASAEAACLQGLRVADDPRTRGALLFNLGRISEAIGALAQAQAHYAASLDARPDNATTQKRLRVVTKQLEAAAESSD